MTKQKIITFFLIGGFILILFCLIKLLNHPIINNDEGIYWSTFLNVNGGHALYKETFFSQLPGFFITIYPGFILLGKTLFAARTMILFWTVIGLIGLTGLLGEAGILAVLALLSIPIFLQQIVTFQSDALAVVFSLTSLVFLMNFKKKQSIVLLTASVLFFSLAFWTKLEVTVAIPIAIVLLQSKAGIKNLLTYLILFAIFSCLIILPFGLKDLIENVIQLRHSAVLVYPFQPFELFKLLNGVPILSMLIVTTLVLAYIQKERKNDLAIISLLWGLTSIVLLIIYRPIFSHHLVFIAVPFALSFSLLIVQYGKLKEVFMLFFFLLMLLNFFCELKKMKSSYLTQDQQMGVDLIRKYTKDGDWVVSDEAVLSPASGRLPPPELVDISNVRIDSGNLSAFRFKTIVLKYKPRLIVAWNGRLNSMKGFEDSLQNYRLVENLQGKKIFLHN